jgi:hypothetical protein
VPVSQRNGFSSNDGTLYFKKRRSKPMPLGIDEITPPQLIEDLLTSFLFGALGLELRININKLERLPAEQRKRLKEVAAEKLAWVAWQTDRGVVAATGRYYRDQSRRLNSHLMFIEWWIPPDTHHAGWWRADRGRPTEWTIGRGERHNLFSGPP